MNNNRCVVVIVLAFLGLATVLVRVAPAQLTPDELKKINKLIAEAHAKQQAEHLDRILGMIANVKSDGDAGSAMASLRQQVQDMKLPPETSVPIYHRLLHHNSPIVQLRATTELANLGAQARGAGADLLRKFRDGKCKFYVREEAALALAKIHYHTPEVINALTREMEKSDVSYTMRRKIAESLGLVGPAAKSALPTLRRLMQQTNDLPAQIQAYRSAGKILALPRPARKQLQSLNRIDWRNADGGYAIFAALQALGTDADFAVGALCEALNQDMPDYIRCMAVQTLGKVGAADPSALKALLSFIAAKEATLSNLAAEAVRNVEPGSPPAVKVLGTTLTHDHVKTRRTAADALLRCDKFAEPALGEVIEALNKVNKQTPRYEAGTLLLILQNIGPKATKAGGVLVDLLAKEPRLHGHLLLTLAEIGVPPAAWPFVKKHLDQPIARDQPMFAAAARAAGALGPHARDAVPILTAALQADFHDRAIYLAQPDGPTFGFVARASKTSTTAKIEAIRALGKIGPAARRAIPLLQKLAAINERNPHSLHNAYAEEARKALNAIQAKQ